MHLKIRVNGHNEMHNPLELQRIIALLVTKRCTKAAKNIPTG